MTKHLEKTIVLTSFALICVLAIVFALTSNGSDSTIGVVIAVLAGVGVAIEASSS